MGLKARFFASRLGFGPQGWDLGHKAGICVGGDGWRRRRKNFCICKSIGHQPFQGRSLKSWKIYIPDTYFLCPCPSAHKNFVAVHCLFDLAIHFFNELMSWITDRLSDELIDKLVTWLIS